MSLPPTPTPPSSVPLRVGMGYWGVYFILKGMLYAQGSINFHPLENLAFALALLMPVRGLVPVIIRQAAAGLAGLGLLYYDSWLPPFAQLQANLSAVSGFSLTYLLELAGRVLDWHSVAVAVVVFSTYRWVASYLRLGAFIVIGLFGLWLVPLLPWELGSTAAATAPTANANSPRKNADPTNPEQQLTAFFASEAQRKVRFEPLTDTAQPFDILMLHLCSLAWDDLKKVNLADHPVLSRLDMVFTQFNTATSYSGSAVLRVLRANCGQQPHAALYGPAADGCFLFSGLKRVGFENTVLLNHDGEFEHFLSQVQSDPALAMPIQSLAGLPAPLRSFDGSPIYSYEAVLSRWLTQRAANPARRVASYYNSISLHDGNRLATGNTPSNLDESYRLRAKSLLDQLDRFFDLAEKSGRRMVVVLVSEHGAALRGGKMQFSGLRDIPTPAITHVPAAIKVIGSGFTPMEPIKVAHPTSYLALSHVLSNMLKDSPFGGKSDLRPYLVNLPTTQPQVAETDNFVLLNTEQQAWMRPAKGVAWQAFQP